MIKDFVIIDLLLLLLNEGYTCTFSMSAKELSQSVCVFSSGLMFSTFELFSEPV